VVRPAAALRAMMERVGFLRYPGSGCTGINPCRGTQRWPSTEPQLIVRQPRDFGDHVDCARCMQNPHAVIAPVVHILQRVWRVWSLGLAPFVSIADLILHRHRRNHFVDPHSVANARAAFDGAVHRGEIRQVALHDLSGEPSRRRASARWSSRRTRARTLWPLASSIAVRLRPMAPIAPQSMGHLPSSFRQAR
jgi:hypothetical protein